MSKWTIAGIVTASVAALTGSFFVGRYTGRYTGYNKAIAELGQAPAAPQKVAANA
jgi:hypothetical protein